MKTVLFFVMCIIFTASDVGFSARKDLNGRDPPCLQFDLNDKEVADMLLNRWKAENLRSLIKGFGPDRLKLIPKERAILTVQSNNKYYHVWEKMIFQCTELEDRELILEQMANIDFVTEMLKKNVIEIHI